MTIIEDLSALQIGLLIWVAGSICSNAILYWLASNAPHEDELYDR